MYFAWNILTNKKDFGMMVLCKLDEMKNLFTIMDYNNVFT